MSTPGLGPEPGLQGFPESQERGNHPYLGEWVGDAIPEGGGYNREGPLHRSHRIATVNGGDLSAPDLLQCTGWAETIGDKWYVRYPGCMPYTSNEKCYI